MGLKSCLGGVEDGSFRVVVAVGRVSLQGCEHACVARAWHIETSVKRALFVRGGGNPQAGCVDIRKILNCTVD